MEAIYARQSVDKKDSLSIAGQIELCQKQTYVNPKVYSDKGYSGKNTNRPQFKKLMDDVEKGLVSKIVVYRLDRFSRSISDFSRLWELLQKHNVEFCSVSETFDTSTPMGRAMLHIIMTFAQLERETTAERVRDNYYQRAALGSWPGGPAPYGFSVDKLPGAGRKSFPTLSPSTYRDTAIRIFTQYAEEDASLGSVARMLNVEQIPAPRRATWDNVALSRILHNPVYVMADEDVYFYYKGKGVLFSNDITAFDGLHGGMIVGKRDRSAGKYNDLRDQRFSLCNHYGLVSADLWLRCQYKLDSNRQLGNRGRGKHSWLTGLMKCASCGYSVKINRDKDKYYLVCSGRSNLGLCDQSIRVDLRALEASIEEELEQLLQRCPSLPPEHDPADLEANRAIEKIDQKINRLIAALAESSDITTSYINHALSDLDKDRQAILERQARNRLHPDRADLRNIVFRSLDFEEKKLVASQFINSITLADETATVIWNI